MKNILTVCLCCFICIAKAQTKTDHPTPAYDSVLAKKLGADQYGMKHYIMAFLKSGPNQITDSLKRIELQRAHLKNIIRLANEGKLIVAGPFLDDQPVEGIFIFNVETIEEAKALTNTDPAIQSGELVMELRPWYGSAALVEISALHQKIQKKSVADF
ncbi:MAG TPA: YciI family protein [Puia sp.]|nr:YciI family protein [Puia sp.]